MRHLTGLSTASLQDHVTGQQPAWAMFMGQYSPKESIDRTVSTK